LLLLLSLEFESFVNPSVGCENGFMCLLCTDSLAQS
jgi:hypothetical protein